MFEQPKLPYEYDSLEPHVDARTMEIHYTKHHAGYTKKLNDALVDTDYVDRTIEEILAVAGETPAAIRNNAGGFYNHDLFWSVMSPDGGGEPEGLLADRINEDFGSFEDFKNQFSGAAGSRFGSGWAWLIKKEDGSLAVTSTPNQDNPLMDVIDEDQKGEPILGLDVWEHAYYLNYQNRRPDYIEAFFSVINWEEVSKNYER
ncbi:MAG: Fe-Mn family superoxide dismutase [Candidatus Paceibacteria bacterium]|jgi:Fe-Mn family superoxide dismutase